MNYKLSCGNELTLAEAFKLVAEEAELLFCKLGIKLKGFHSPELFLFNELSSSAQQIALVAAKNFLESYQSDDRDIFDAEKRALWKAFTVFGLVPPSDLLQRLIPGRAIEMYTAEGRQIWRNLACLDLCSYTLEEIVSLDVLDRYQRPSFIEKKCEVEVGALINGQRSEIFDPRIAVHEAIETMSDEMYRLSLKHEMFAALRDSDGDLRAWLVMTDAHHVGIPVSAPRQVSDHFLELV
ncbi:MAG: hypothetical protein EOP06_15150 [Proteobacteria bacterium]|nr:MAG: hypothetical protein EOP06_15150 [Pseudomonadota bacterium]